MADDNVPYIAGFNIGRVLSALQNAALSLFRRSSDNHMKANFDQRFYSLKDPRNRVLRIIGVSSLICSIRIHTSRNFLLFPWEN